MKKSSFSLSKRIVDHLIQAVLIFTSVFLAFWLSDYREKQKEQRLVNSAIESVIGEISSNADVLKRLEPALLNTINRAGEFMMNSLDTASVFNHNYFTEGELRFSELLTSDSYQFLNQNSISVDIDKRLLINRIYKQQEFVEGAIDDMLSFFRQRELFDGTRARENYILYYMHIREIDGQIGAMKREYETALQRLEK
ncbi:MAG: hypothetical protein LAT67_10820 [Balneolales bacterium]|nr:hypothetical protein [Balneolales bacterium]